MNLIYLCVFHNESYINLLSLLLETVSKKAHINFETTDILICTSAQFYSKIIIETSHLKIPITFFILDANTLFESACARLHIFEFKDITKYHKLLYIDTDILINGDLNIILNLDIEEDTIYALEEGIISHEYWGAQFFDFKEIDKKTTAFTTGVMLFINTKNMQNLFKKIQTQIDKFSKDKRKEVPVCLEQPFIVYNAIMTNSYNNTLLKEFVINNPSSLCDKIILHFPGGPGDYSSKFEKMTAYLNRDRQSPKPLPNTSIELIGLCVSYNYMDTLKFMLPINHLHFTRLFIITNYDDIETLNYCIKYENVSLLYFDFNNSGKKFDKYGALNYGLRKVYEEYPDSWYLIIDSDILLPTNFINILCKEDLNPNCLYGSLRVNASKSSEIKRLLEMTDKFNDNVFNNILCVKETPPSILGCFQLFKKKHIYHGDFITAGDGDYKFGYDNFNLFCLLQNLFTIHLGTPGVNWGGKKISFIDDININIETLYFNCSMSAINKYYNERCELIKYGDSKNIYDDIWTCSNEMRSDIDLFFKPFSHFTIAEIGSHKGYTTKILSTIFSKVYAIDNNDECIMLNKELNKLSDNIRYVKLDLYKDNWTVLPNTIDVVFIDAIHSYEACKNDILNSIKQFSNLKYIIFDDYGVWDGVKTAVDEQISKKTLSFEKFIGITNVPGPDGIVKDVHEGIICSVNKTESDLPQINKFKRFCHPAAHLFRRLKQR